MQVRRISRKERLFIWLRRHGLSYTALGEKLAISTMSASRLCKAKRINSIRHDQLRELGIPAALLPKKEDRPRDDRKKLCSKKKPSC
jgi:hypothetical protein